VVVTDAMVVLKVVSDFVIDLLEGWDVVYWRGDAVIECWRGGGFIKVSFKDGGVWFNDYFVRNSDPDLFVKIEELMK